MKSKSQKKARKSKLLSAKKNITKIKKLDSRPMKITITLILRMSVVKRKWVTWSSHPQRSVFVTKLPGGIYVGLFCMTTNLVVIR